MIYPVGGVKQSPIPTDSRHLRGERERAGFLNIPWASGPLPTMHPGRLPRAQLTTYTSGAACCPIQCKHSTQSPFSLCLPHVAKHTQHGGVTDSHTGSVTLSLQHTLTRFPTYSIFSNTANLLLKEDFGFSNSVNDPSLEVLSLSHLIYVQPYCRWLEKVSMSGGEKEGSTDLKSCILYVL